VIFKEPKVHQGTRVDQELKCSIFHGITRFFHKYFYAMQGCKKSAKSLPVVVKEINGVKISGKRESAG
ncbi:MAG TPA: hypothetical protein VF298_05195, partial [Bacteroidales bacterium]